MALAEVLAHIDSEIARLQQAKALLSGPESTKTVKVGRGRPKGSKNSVPVAAPKASKSKGKRNLSPEGRKAIADAMKRRWAERRAQSGK
jgi:hypothetical protein